MPWERVLDYDYTKDILNVVYMVAAISPNNIMSCIRSYVYELRWENMNRTRISTFNNNVCYMENGRVCLYS